MASFTSYTALLAAIRDAIADYAAGNFVIKSYEINGRTMTYRSLNELLDAEKRLVDLAAAESGSGGLTFITGKVSRG